MDAPLFFKVTYAQRSPFARFRDQDVRIEWGEGKKELKSIKTRKVEPKLEITDGSKWLDVLGTGIGKPWFVLSERAIEAFQKEGITGCRPFPCTIEEIKGQRLKAVSPPWYFYLEVAGLLDIDFRESGIPESQCTDEILDGNKRPSVTRLVPDVASWDGSDFMTLRNYPTGHLICSRRIVELAHKYQLTNFRFEPIDLLNHQAITWRIGVKYLGKKWPPDWYPTHARTIKSLDQWLAELALAETVMGFMEHKNRIEPIMDFGLEALPGLMRIMQTESLQARKNAAYAVHCLKTEDYFRIPKNVAALAEEYLEESQLEFFKQPI